MKKENNDGQVIDFMEAKMKFMFDHNDEKTEKKLHQEEVQARWNGHFSKLKRMQKLLNWDKAEYKEEK